MALVKVTALKYVTIIDPFPMEGVGHVTIQLSPGQYQAYHMYDHQADRLQADLEAAQDALMLTYEIEWGDVDAINTKRYALISFIDVTPGIPILLGVAPAGSAVEECAVKINESFDGGTLISVGDVDVHARFMAADENKPQITGTYKNDVDFRYTAEKEIYVYFPAGTPTQGEAEIFVYLA